jgi:hypothetical protein
MSKGSVIQEWLQELPWKHQTVVLCALRGCDGKSKEDPMKPYVRCLRATVLQCADPTSTFRLPVENWPSISAVRELDEYPMHWVTHFMHAAEIIGYYHPGTDESVYWEKLYLRMCYIMHVGCETKAQLDDRLRTIRA